jgi:hypothetical protein
MHVLATVSQEWRVLRAGSSRAFVFFFSAWAPPVGRGGGYARDAMRHGRRQGFFPRPPSRPPISSKTTNARPNECSPRAPPSRRSCAGWRLSLQNDHILSRFRPSPPLLPRAPLLLLLLPHPMQRVDPYSHSQTQPRPPRATPGPRSRRRRARRRGASGGAGARATAAAAAAAGREDEAAAAAAACASADNISISRGPRAA